jgi:uncharacterized integral membrane protein (TIGR00698 family)
MTPGDNRGRQAALSSADFGGDLFGEIYLAGQTGAPGTRTAPTGSRLHGLLVCGVASAAAAWLSEHYGFPIILLGLLVGLSLNFFSRDPLTHPGLDLASSTFLRFGIVALGFQVTLGQIAELGVWPFVALLSIMALTMASGIGAARVAGMSRYSGILAGGATAICGASAALALYGVIGRERLSQSQFALTLVSVSLASALAMSLYPLLASELALSDGQAGFLIGASVHDVAQAIGGGFAFSDAAGAEATIVKLSRVAMLAPIIVAISLWIGPADPARGAASWRRLLPPWFIVAFMAIVIANSLLSIPAAARDAMLVGTKGLLLLAVTATAIRSRLDLLVELGWRSATPVAAASLCSFVASLAYVILGR